MAPPIAPHGIPGHLVDFVEALRAHGISVGPSETVDAGRVLAVLGLGDREVLREGLACAVLRRPDHRPGYDALFDLWWPAALGARAAGELGERQPGARGSRARADRPPAVGDTADLQAALAALFAADPDRRDTDPELTALVAAIVAAHGAYRSSRGTSYSAYQSIKAMGLDELTERLLAGLLAGYGADPSPAQRQVAAAVAERQIAQLRRLVDAETRRRSAEQLGRAHVQTYAVPTLAEHVEFLRASGDQLRALRQTVAPLARTLATRLAVRRRRARAGAIDLRKTLRASMSTGGVPIDLVHRKPRPGRPELVVLCDVSGSVAGFSHFTLLLVHALRQQFARVRVFAFVDTADEVTDLFGPTADLVEVIEQIVGGADVVTGDGRSDYGHALTSFRARFPGVLSPRSSLLVLGDGRTNYRDPAVGVLAELVAASRHAHWLNPEPESSWGGGDSAARRYAEVIPMHECRSAAQLAAVIDTLLPA